MSVDPPRLLDPASGASDDLRALLRSADGDGPSHAQLQRLAARIEPQLATPAAPATVAVGKVIAVGAVLAIVAGVISFVVGRDSTPQAPPNTVMVVDAARPAIDAGVIEHATPPTIDGGVIAMVVDAAPIVDPPSPPPRTRRPTATEPPPPPTPVEPVEDELAVLGRAQRALVAGDAAGALELAERHAKTFATGTMIEEREAIAIEALARLGRADAAASRFEKFRAAHPRSSYRHRLERLLAQ